MKPEDDDKDVPEPGDTVIELRNGVPYIYTLPADGETGGSTRKEA